MEFRIEGESPKVNTISMGRDEDGDIGFFVNDHMFAYFHHGEFIVREYVLEELKINFTRIGGGDD